MNDKQPPIGVALLPLAAAAAGCGSKSGQNDPAPSTTTKPNSPPDDSHASQTKTSPPRPKLTPAQASLATAAAYLFQQQQDDGSWPSDYKQLEGAAMTSLVLYALSQIPTESRPSQFDQRVSCAMSYLESGIEAKGYIVRPDGTPDYPTYATTLTLIAADALEHDLAAGDREKLVRYLLAAQLTADRGFPPNHPHHGGWDMLGDPAARGVTIGTNISVTRYVLEALRAQRRRNPQDAFVKQIDAAFERAVTWLARCHHPGDGGFFFHPDRFDPMNKAGWEDEKNERPRSYGTATCDGLRGLLYCGAKLDDPRVTAALAWLEKHDDLKTVPGFEQVPKELGWHEGLRFYYYATLAKLLTELPPGRLPKHRQALPEVVRSLQHADGHWQNTSAAMREDDPILATSLAMIALSKLR